MGNPRWPPRNHEKLQMLVSLQPTKIKTCMICAVVCFLTQGIQCQHYLVRKTVRSHSNPKWPAKKWIFHICCSSIYAKSLMGSRNTNKKSCYMLWNTMNARPPLFYQILIKENNIKCKMATTHSRKWDYDCYVPSTMMTLLRHVLFMFGHRHSKQTVNSHIMCSGNINEITEWTFININVCTANDCPA